MSEPDSPFQHDFPQGTQDERELLLTWLRYLRGAVL